MLTSLLRVAVAALPLPTEREPTRELNVQQQQQQQLLQQLFGGGF